MFFTDFSGERVIATKPTMTVSNVVRGRMNGEPTSSSMTLANISDAYEVNGV